MGVNASVILKKLEKSSYMEGKGHWAVSVKCGKIGANPAHSPMKWILHRHSPLGFEDIAHFTTK